MFEIAHGIEVYYSSNKNNPNIVYFSDDTYKEYEDGGMLFEIIPDEVIYMLTEKVKNMIAAFPDKDLPLTRESVVGLFKWIYGTIEDEDRPVATELFRSSFNNSIQETIAAIEVGDEYASVEEFFMDVYESYMKDIKMFCMYASSIAAANSGLADKYQKNDAKTFEPIIEEYYEIYTKKLKVRSGLFEVVHLKDFLSLLIFEQCRMIRNDKALKECANCGSIFIPTGRKDSIYCHLAAPGYPGKTCKEVGAYLRRKTKRQTDPAEHEHYNYMGRKYNMVRRLGEHDKSDKNEELISRYKKDIDDEMKRYYRKKDENATN